MFQFHGVLQPDINQEAVRAWPFRPAQAPDPIAIACTSI